jgi:hypothetical protein
MSDLVNWDAIIRRLICFAIHNTAHKCIGDGSLIPCRHPKSQTWWLTLHPHRPVPKSFSNALRAIFSIKFIYKAALNWFRGSRPRANGFRDGVPKKIECRLSHHSWRICTFRGHHAIELVKRSRLTGFWGQTRSWTIVDGRGLDVAMAGQSANFKLCNWPHRLCKAPKERKELWRATLSIHARIDRSWQRSDCDVDQTSLREMPHTEPYGDFWLQTPQTVTKLYLYCRIITKLEIWRHLDALLTILFFRAFLIFRAPTDWILRIT